jgi:putative DNA primase/helicase
MSDDRPPRPDPVEPNVDAVPETLREREQWVCWRYKWKPDRNEYTKVPYNAETGRRAKSNTPDTWTSFGAAVAYHERADTDTDGIGFMFAERGTVAGIDLDDCRDPDDGDLEAWADDLLEDVRTFTEISPSGTGLHLYGLGFVPDGGNRGDVPDAPGHVEMYDSGRFFTVTGACVDGTPDDVEQVNDGIDDVHAEYIRDDEPDTNSSKAAGDGGVAVDSAGATPGAGVDTGGSTSGGSDLTDAELIEKAKNAENGEKFRQLWNGSTSGYSSHSEADLALCGLLAFWTGGDRSKIDDLFRESGLYRDKWDEDRGDDTYGERTIDKALSGTTEYYEPPSGNDSPPAERVDSDLVDALLDEPAAWIDADAKTWTVRDTDDHDADAIADAVRDGELPGDAWQALADAIMSGDVDLPDAIEDGLQAWRKDPDAWTVETSHEFDGAELSPDAVAADLEVPLSELGEERNGRIAYHVWERIRDGDHAKVIARTGVDGDDELLRYHSDVGVWREDGAEVLRTLARTALADTYSGGVKNELVEQVLATRCDGEPWGQKPIDRLGADPNTVPVANGTVDLTDGELRRRQPTEYVLAALPVEYDPDAECPTFGTYLEEVCPRSVDRKKLQEYVGYTLMHWDLPFHKALFLAGPQASGKSTFLDTVNALLGGDPDDERGTTCSLSPQEMTDEKFAGYDLRKAWANIRSDIPNDLIENTGKFKELVAGDPVKVEKKYQDPITIRPTAKHLFAANTLPEADVDDDAFFRRILLVSFPNTVPRDERDPDLGDKLEAELSGILNWAIEGLDRLREQEHFTGAPTPGMVQAKWRAWGSSVDRFKQRILEATNDPDDAVPKRDALDAYRRFCEAEGIPAKSERTFFDNLKQDADIGESRRRIDGSRKRVYTNVRLLTDRIDDVEDTEHDDSDQTGLF